MHRLTREISRRENICTDDLELQFKGIAINLYWLIDRASLAKYLRDIATGETAAGS